MILKTTASTRFKKLISTALCFFSIALLPAQTPQWNWAKNAGADKDESGSQILCDPSGNVFSWGTFESSSIQFGTTVLNNPVPPANQHPAYYVAMHDASGNVLWAKTFPQEMNDIKSAGLDAQGNLYLTGQFYNTLTLGGQSITCPVFGATAFIVKYSPAGNVIWLKQKGRRYPSQSLSLFFSLKKWDNGHLIVTGRSFNDTIEGHYLRSCNWLAKMDTAGNYSSFVALDTVNYATGTIDITGMAVDGQLNTYITGNYEGIAAFNAPVWHLDTVPGRGYRQAFLAKFDRNLNFTWSKITNSVHHSGAGYGYVKSVGIANDPQGNVYMAGGFQTDSIVFDNTHAHKFPISPFSTASGNFLTRYKPDGNILWDSLFMIHSPFTTNFTGICADKVGGIYCGGVFSGALSVNNYTVYAGNGNIFVAKFGQDGRALWLQTNTSSKSSIGGMDEDGRGNIYVTGHFMQGNAAFGTNTLVMATPVQGNPYAGDLFIARLGNCNISGPTMSPNTSQHLCNNSSVTFSSSLAVYNTWSTGDTTATIHINQAGTYFVYGTDQHGCYAPSLTVAVTAGTVNSAAVITSGTLTAHETTGAYQWTDCNDAYHAISTATLQAYAPGQSGSYALVITQNGCTDTSACYQVVLTDVSIEKQKDPSAALQFFPNPNNGQCYVSFTGAGKQGRLVLTDVLGKKCFEKEIYTGTTALNVDELANGMYQLIFITGGKQSSQKMIIQR